MGILIQERLQIDTREDEKIDERKGTHMPCYCKSATKASMFKVSPEIVIWPNSSYSKNWVT